MSTYSFEDDFRNLCTNISKEVMPGCGLIYELYQQRFSSQIDSIIETLPASEQLIARELAREEFDYISSNEIEEQMLSNKVNGLCSHGLDPNCCPCGCGDIDNF